VESDVAQDGREGLPYWRDAALVVTGIGMLVFETLQPVAFGKEPDKVIIGAALALLGIVPVLQKSD
jgi:hypothetical protein